MTEKILDLRGVACPMNFVKTKLFVDKMSTGEKVLVLLDEGEPVESVSSSIVAEGHLLESTEKKSEGHFAVLIQKV
jgi:TusA-related sulfurtransferase